MNPLLSRLVTIAFTFFVTGLSRGSAATELKGSPEELASYLAGLPQIVSVTGEGEVRVPADKAEVCLKIGTESKSLNEALRANQDIRGRLAAFFKEGGIGSNQVQGARFSSTQKFGVFSEKAKSHRVDHLIKVTVRDEREFQWVAGAVDRWAEVHFLSVETQHSDKEAMKARAQELSLEKAAERRKLFEEKLGVRLVPKRFTDLSVDSGPGNPGDGYYGNKYSPNLASMEKVAPGRASIERSFSDSEGAARSEVASSFGELVFRAKIRIDYSVENR